MARVRDFTEPADLVRGEKGSQRWMRCLANETKFQGAFLECLRGTRRGAEQFNEGRLRWLSPLAPSYVELRDNVWQSVGLTNIAEGMKAWWPARGPVWDGVALFEPDSGAPPAVILCEAKSHAGEIASTCRAEGSSRSQIETALSEAKVALNAKASVDWLNGYYQFANRLAWLYFARTRCHANVWLASIYFVGDRFRSGSRIVIGPSAAEEWRSPLSKMHGYLGLPERHPLSDFAPALFLDVTSPLM